MLKRLFLSIIILSALTSEGGNYYTANLIDYYLINFSHLEMVQDSRNALSYFGEQNSLQRKGTPVAFFKKLSQDTINSQTSRHDSNLEFGFIFSFSIALIILIARLLWLNIQRKSVSVRALLCRADSSPPAYR